jgi:hypothetical protein
MKLGNKRRPYETVCHPEREHVAKGLCRSCHWAWYAHRPAHLQAIVDAHPARLEAMRRERRRKPTLRLLPSLSRERVLRSRYGITLVEYDAMLRAQGGRCAVCQELPKMRPLHVDHRHDNGVIRGLLCARCNTALAAVDDDALHTKLVIYAQRGAAPAPPCYEDADGWAKKQGSKKSLARVNVRSYR